MIAHDVDLVHAAVVVAVGDGRHVAGDVAEVVVVGALGRALLLDLSLQSLHRVVDQDRSAREKIKIKVRVRHFQVGRK